ncbi:IS982 family transposase [Coleofasciculus sp. FACHB-SPT36]|uniref:IS982 family transposase n=1 Tax=Cyanophyceae TaxID=3028117 RepID=UPI00168BAEE9|nr:IS982 family transposase [Coleofasciculus sp. FACHB-SPT36]MBD2540535.1 IS982 family transposase [Coleofasciculus sp. FACHB-SPT36]
MLSLEELFCSVDDFCLLFEPLWHKQLMRDALKHRHRHRQLCLSEIMTIEIAFHQSHYRNFKAFYQEKVHGQWSAAFPKLVSYQRFVEWMPSTLIPLSTYLHSCFGQCTGVSVMDSTKIAVCHNRRIKSHKVFKDIGRRGKTCVDWFFGFKLHLVCNDQGELLNIAVTAGNIDDRKPVLTLLKGLSGKVVADRGYISQKLFEQLLTQMGIQLITKPKRNMNNKLMPLIDKLLIRKRDLIETIIDQLKNISHIEHSRHRSPVNFLVNLVCGLIAYCHQPKKPSLNINAFFLPSA